MGIRTALEINFREHMQICLWTFYFMYLNPRRVLQIASGHLKMSFCMVVTKLVLQRCFLPRKYVILDSGLPTCLT